MKVNENWKVNDNKYQCPYCKKLCKKHGICTHIWKVHGKGKNHNPGTGHKKGTPAWNKGLTKETSEAVRRNSANLSEKMKEVMSRDGYINPFTKEKNRKNVSIRQTLKNSGGKCKWYKVDGSFVQGNWERDFAIKMNELGINWIRCNKNHIIKYKINGKTKRYTPDFFLPEQNKLIEIKGYWWGNDKQKMKNVIKQNKHIIGKIKVIRKDKFYKLIECESKDKFLQIIGLVAQPGRAPR